MSELHFLRPWWWLALIPMLTLIALAWRSRSANDAWQRVFDPALLERLWLEHPGRISRLPLVLLAVAWTLTVVVLAGPVWQRLPQPVYQSQEVRIVVLDLSPSMQATDLNPNRYERARFKITDILHRSREGRIGLIAFAGEPHAVTPLTEDAATIANLLPALSPDIMPTEGDAAGPALAMAGELLRRAGAAQGDVLLISDGFGDPAATINAAHDLKQQGHRLSVLAIGTAEGAPLPDGQGGFIMTRLESGPLREAARAGGGIFSKMTADDADLGTVLPAPIDRDVQKAANDSGVQRWAEQGIWLLPLILLLAIGGFRRGWLATLAVVLILPAPRADAFEWRDLWQRADQQAAQALALGKAEEAAKQFTVPDWRGTAQYQQQDYAGAIESFRQSNAPDARYNLGNALAKSGQLEEAAETYRDVLKGSPNHADAKANLDLVEELLQQQQQQQQQDENSSSEQNQSEGDASKQQADSEDQKSADAEAHKQDTSKPQDSEASDKDAQARPDKAESVPSTEETEAEPEDGTADAPTQDQQEPRTEQDIALDQWLKRIPDDPAGLLRQKFMLEHLRRKEGQNP